MCWKGLSETPSNRKKSLEGLAVGLFVRYPLIHNTWTSGAFTYFSGIALASIEWVDVHEYDKEPVCA
jgi:hypothetical protein